MSNNTKYQWNDSKTKKKMDDKLAQKQRELIMYVVVGSAIGLGFILGKKHQKRIIDTAFKGVRAIAPDPTPMFPSSMSIPEIKEALKLIEGAEFMDALVTNVNGVQRLIIR